MLNKTMENQAAAFSSVKRKPKRLSLEDKVALIQESSGMSQRQLARKYDVGKSQVQSILHRRANILEAFRATLAGSDVNSDNHTQKLISDHCSFLPPANPSMYIKTKVTEFDSENNYDAHGMNQHAVDIADKKNLHGEFTVLCPDLGVRIKTEVPDELASCKVENQDPDGKSYEVTFPVYSDASQSQSLRHYSTTSSGAVQDEASFSSEPLNTWSEENSADSRSWTGAQSELGTSWLNVKSEIEESSIGMDFDANEIAMQESFILDKSYNRGDTASTEFCAENMCGNNSVEMSLSNSQLTSQSKRKGGKMSISDKHQITMLDDTLSPQDMTHVFNVDQKQDSLSQKKQIMPSKLENKRNELTITGKVELIKLSGTMSARKLAKLFSVGRTQVHNILTKKEAILDIYEKRWNINRKRKPRKGDNDEINELTWQWFCKLRDCAIPITGPMLQRKALELAEYLGKSNFKASNGWLDSFRKRHCVGQYSMASSGGNMDILAEAAATHGGEKNKPLNLPGTAEREDTESSVNLSESLNDLLVGCGEQCHQDNDLNTEHSKPTATNILLDNSRVSWSWVENQGEKHGEYEPYGTQDAETKSEVGKYIDDTATGNVSNFVETDCNIQREGGSELRNSDNSDLVAGTKLYIPASVATDEAADGKDSIIETCKDTNEALHPDDRPENVQQDQTNNLLQDAGKLEALMALPEPPTKPLVRPETKRNELCLRDKVRLIEQSSNKSCRQLAEMFQIGKGQVHSLLKKKEDVMFAYNSNWNENRKRQCRKTDNEIINIMTWQWLCQAGMLNMSVTGPMLQEQAKIFALELGKVNFKASNGWLDSFKKRHNVTMNSISGKVTNASVPDLVDVEKKISESLPESLESNDCSGTGEISVGVHKDIELDLNYQIYDNSGVTMPACNNSASVPNACVLPDEKSTCSAVYSLKCGEGSTGSPGSAASFAYLDSTAELDKKPIDSVQLQAGISESGSIESNPSSVSSFGLDMEVDHVISDSDFEDESSRTQCEITPEAQSISESVFPVSFISRSSDLSKVQTTAQRASVVLGPFASGLSSGITNYPSFAYRNLEMGVQNLSEFQEQMAALQKSSLRRRKSSLRHELTLKEKVQLIKESETKSRRQLREMFHVGRTQVHTTLNRKEEIMASFHNYRNDSRKRHLRHNENEKINEMTWHWFCQARSTNQTVSGPMLQEKAKEFAAELGRDVFKASNGWLHSFKHRHGISVSMVAGHTYEAPEVSDIPPNVDEVISDQAEKVEDDVLDHESYPQAEVVNATNSSQV